RLAAAARSAPPGPRPPSSPTRRIGFVFQDQYLLPQCTVLENVLIPTLVAADDRAAVKERALKLLERVGLSHRLEHRPAELSGGERGRAALARALVHQPALLLADEPTGNLDRKTARDVGQLLPPLPRERRPTLVAVTHSADLAALLPRPLQMEDGALAPADGPGLGDATEVVRPARPAAEGGR